MDVELAPPHPEDDEFAEGVDMSGNADVQRRGVAPSLRSAQEKWLGMFKRSSPLVAWKVGFRTFRRAHVGDTSFPEGFPSLQEFFDKSSNSLVFDWIVGIYKELIEEATAAGVYLPGDKTELDHLRDHVSLLAARHGNAKIQVRNPKWRDPVASKPTNTRLKLAMFQPKPPRPSSAELQKQRQVAIEAVRVPPTIQATFFMTKTQRVFLAMLVRKFHLFDASSEGYNNTKLIRVAVNHGRWAKVARALGKMCIFLRTRHNELSGNKSSTSVAPSSSLKRPREESTERCVSPSLKKAQP